MLLLFSTQPVDRNQDEGTAQLLEVHSFRMRGILRSCDAGDSCETIGAFFAREGGQALEQPLPERLWNLHC